MSMFFAPRFQILDISGRPVVGAQLLFFAAGTTTPITVYSDVALTVALPQPVVDIASGIFPAIYTPPGLYKVRLLDSAGVLIWETDNVDPAVSTNLGAIPIAQGGTGATTAATARANLGAASATALTALQTDVATNYYSKIAFPIATQAEAIAGTANDRLMSALTARQAMPGGLVNSAYAELQASTLCAAMPAVGVDPTTLQGTLIASITYTALELNNILDLSGFASGFQSGGGGLVFSMFAIFKDAGLLTSWVGSFGGQSGYSTAGRVRVTAGDIVSHTYTLRGGALAGNNALTVNSVNSGPPSQRCNLTIQEMRV